ncbi:MAG: hypothetical protein R3209_15540 [Salinimicrobium sediminis]|nr:hypothetical protein [Salinimicrobium sediminis]
MSRLHLRRLKNAGKELNEVLGLTDPCIETEKVDREELESLIIEAADLIQEGEEEAFSDQTLFVIKTLTEGLDVEDEDPDGMEDEELEEELEEDDEAFEEEEQEFEKEPMPKKKEETKKPAKAKKKSEPEKEIEYYEELVPKKKRGRKGPSAYGTTIQILAKSPDMTLQDLKEDLTEYGVNVEEKNASINTAFFQFEKIYQLLKAAGKLK